MISISMAWCCVTLSEWFRCNLWIAACGRSHGASSLGERTFKEGEKTLPRKTEGQKKRREISSSLLSVSLLGHPWRKCSKLKPQRENEGLREAGLPRPLSRTHYGALSYELLEESHGERVPGRASTGGWELHPALSRLILSSVRFGSWKMEVNHKQAFFLFSTFFSFFFLPF